MDPYTDAYWDRMAEDWYESQEPDEEELEF